MKRMPLVKRFLETSGVHGTNFLVTKAKTPWLQKFFYRVLFLICILSVLGNVSVLLQDAFSSESTFVSTTNKPINLGKEEDPEFFPDYPRLTVCRTPSYKPDLNYSFSDIVEYSFLALGYPYVPLTPDELTKIVYISMKDNETRLPSHTIEFKARLNELEERFRKLQKVSESFNLKQFVIKNSLRCEGFFAYCVAMVYHIDCCKIFHPILTNMGLCYTLEDPSYFLHLIGSSSIEFSLIVDLVSPPRQSNGIFSKGRSTEVGYNMYFTDPLEVPVYFQPEEGQKLITGGLGYINVQLVKTDRSALHTHWTTLVDSCPKWPSGKDPLKGGSNPYTHRDCDTFARFVSLRNACKCESIFFPGNATMRYCEPRDLYVCYPQNTLRNNSTTRMDVCLQPCIAYHYKSQASYVRLGDPSFSRLQIMYDSRQFVNQEYRTTTMSSLFSQIGGSLALYLGASIFTMVEIITFVASWLWYWVCPSRKTK